MRTYYTDLRTLQKDIATFNNNISDKAFNLILEKALRIQRLAQALVRVATGTLRSDIRVEIRTNNQDIVTIAIVAGGTQINPRTGRICDYAAIVEQKYPFMQPAFSAINSSIPSELKGLVATT